MEELDYEADLFWAEDLYDNIAYEKDAVIRIEAPPELLRRVLKSFIIHTREIKRIVDANG